MSERAASTVIEVAGSPAISLSQPAAVAALIEQAASAVAARQQVRQEVRRRFRSGQLTELLMLTIRVDFKS